MRSMGAAAVLPKSLNVGNFLRLESAQLRSEQNTHLEGRGVKLQAFHSPLQARCRYRAAVRPEAVRAWPRS